jgi:hypothetical protein
MVGALDSRVAALVAASRQDSTVAGYAVGWEHWRVFCRLTCSPVWLPFAPVESPEFKAQREQLSRFVAYLDCSVAVKAKTIGSYINAVRQLHLRRTGCDSLGAHMGPGTLVALILDGVSHVNRVKGVHTSRKAGLTWDLLCRVAPHLASSDPELLAIMGLGVAFMLRGSELVLCPRSRHHLLVQDVTFLSGGGGGAPCGVRICIKSSKMNPEPVFRSYNANGTALCVVAWLWRHWCSLGVKPDPAARLFAGFTRSTLAKAIQRVVRVHHIGDPALFSTHSLRRGGASTLLNSGKVHPKFIQDFGRWKSDIWLRVYASMSEANQLHLTRICAETLEIPPPLPEQCATGLGLGFGPLDCAGPACAGSGHMVHPRVGEPPEIRVLLAAAGFELA